MPAQSRLDDLKIDRGSQPGSSSLPWVGGLLIVIILLTGFLFFWLRRESAPAVRIVTVRESETNTRRTVLNASGYVTARRQATVSSKVTGKILEVLVEEGMNVKEGQVLARLDNSNVEANLQLAVAQLDASKASLEETRVRLNEAQLELDRVARLAQTGVSSQSELDAARAEVDSLKARLKQLETEIEVAERQVSVWKQQVEDTLVRAPFDGVVISKDAQPGEMISPVSAGSGFTRTGICTIVDMSSLEIEVDVNESYINRVETGQPVQATLDAYPDWKIPAKVIAIIPTADRQKATVKVRIGFDQLDPRILPDMGVKVAFRSSGEEMQARQTAWVIPKSAVIDDNGRDVVFVVQNGKVERRAIQIANQGETEVTVLSGLSAGERIVSEVPKDLKDGDRVKEISQ